MLSEKLLPKAGEEAGAREIGERGSQSEYRVRALIIESCKVRARFWT